MLLTVRGGGPGVVLILCGFVVYTMVLLVESLPVLFVLVFLDSF